MIKKDRLIARGLGVLVAILIAQHLNYSWNVWEVLSIITMGISIYVLTKK